MTLFIKQATAFDHNHPEDWLLEEGKIVARAARLPVPTTAHEVIDGSGFQLFPGLVEGHAHIDKSVWGREWYHNDVPRDLTAIIANEREYRRTQKPDIQLQSERITRECIKHGTSFIRTHIDIDNECGLDNFAGVLATKEKLRGQVDIETVAFPQSGILRSPGTEAYLEKALQMGADQIGGLDPCSYEKDPVTHLDILFRLATQYGKGVDIHLHELGELGAFSTELIINRTREYGLAGKVTISHAFCLGMVDADAQKRFADQLAELDIAIATTAPTNVAVPPFDLLRAAGVRICAGNDGVRDTWNPYGNGDMLQRAMLMGLRYRWRKDSEILKAARTVTEGGAQVMRLENYGLNVGCRADMVLVPARSMAEAVVSTPTGRTVIKNGVVIARDGECLF
ncbi:amidohydrolase family protein [Erwinia sp.]|uniref:amidohydrolase family protein n=1 Tax=Erwinia citreus TaxID=558 RepID=UPI003C71E0D5